mmetsp:Transcript_10008/g.24972  ORF Transcript_10008/g.24972 Transcript_10008/m.24972 type:complete len:228 (+) Transcript_10008:64-747(+)
MMVPLSQRHRGHMGCRSRKLAAYPLLAVALVLAALAWALERNSAGAWCGSTGRPHTSQLRLRTLMRVAEKKGPTGKLIRCPGCGKAWREDCDGTGKIVGGIASVIKDFKLITASSPCPRYTGTYERRGKDLKAFFDPEGDIAANAEKMTIPATWRALTKISLREVADVKSAKTGDAVKPYEKFKVVDVIKRGNQHFLKLEDKNGWAFDRGVAGAWNGRPIAEWIAKA